MLKSMISIIETWDTILGVSGGALSPTKCFAYLGAHIEKE